MEGIPKRNREFTTSLIILRLKERGIDVKKYRGAIYDAMLSIDHRTICEGVETVF